MSGCYFYFWNRTKQKKISTFITHSDIHLRRTFSFSAKSKGWGNVLQSVQLLKSLNILRYLQNSILALTHQVWIWVKSVEMFRPSSELLHWRQNNFTISHLDVKILIHSSQQSWRPWRSEQLCWTNSAYKLAITLILPSHMFPEHKQSWFLNTNNKIAELFSTKLRRILAMNWNSLTLWTRTSKVF